MVTIRIALVQAAGRLTVAGVSAAEREAAWLLAHLLGCSVGEMRLRAEKELTAAQQAEFDQLVRRRESREPLQYILGTEEFMGLRFQVTPAVLIPRSDTETLVQEALRRLGGGLSQGGGLSPDPGRSHPSRRLRVADIGTGSGAIAVAVATLLAGAQVVATDLSADALAVAHSNALANGVAGRIQFRQGDLLQPLGAEELGGFDAILSNPPYVGEGEIAHLMPEVRDWEPRLALTPGPDGLSLYRRLLDGLPLLSPGGFLGVEVGAGQAAAVAQLFQAAGCRVTVHRDPAGIERAVFAQPV